MTGEEGNHGEDVKEYYFYLDSTPTHSYMKALYKYPQAEYPYRQLVEESQRRDRHQPEFELMDSGAFEGDRYFDVQVEYAKADADDVLIQITVTNRGPDSAEMHLLPTLWYRNTWSWDMPSLKPNLTAISRSTKASIIETSHPELGQSWFYCQTPSELLFTENETNKKQLFNVKNASPYVKDAFHRYVIEGEETAINPAQTGTKAAAHYRLQLESGESQTIQMRLSNHS